MTSLRKRLLASLLMLAVGGCVIRPMRGPDEIAQPAPPAIADRAVDERILALDPENVTDADVRSTLAKGPVPRVILVHGGIFPVYLSMASFGQFLVEMGYPEARIRDPYDGAWSHSPYEDVERLAGMTAWFYEHDGMPPILIGHSQGGMQVVKILYALSGAYSAAIPVWNPLTDYAESRTSIVDPLTRREQPVVGLRVDYASAVAAGGAAFLLPNQWSMAGRLQTIPDSVVEFTGYTIALDLWAWTARGTEDSPWYESSGKARVRNVTLPAATNHVTAPVTADLPGNPAARAWIDAYRPGTTVPPPDDANILWAADVWYGVKKTWVLEAQHLIRARRTAARPAVAGKLE